MLNEKLILKLKNIDLIRPNQQNIQNKIDNILKSSINYFCNFEIKQENIAFKESLMRILFDKCQHEKCIAKLTYRNTQNLKQIKLFDHIYIRNNHIKCRLIMKNKKNLLKKYYNI